MDGVHVCRTCLRVIENSRYVDLDASDSSALEFKSKLEACVPELTINVVKNPVICEPCLISLEGAFEFKKQCLKTEEEIYAYMFDSDGGAIDLQFIAKRDVDSKDGIKIELNDNYLSPFNIPNDISQESFTVDTKYEPPSPPDYNEKEHYESSPGDAIENTFADEEVQATDEQVQATDEQVQATDEQVQATDEQVQATDQQVQVTNELQDVSSPNVEGTPSQNYSLPPCFVSVTPLSEDLVKILQYESLRLPNESNQQKESDGRSIRLQNESKQQKAFLAVVSSQIIYKCFICKTHYTSKEALLKHSLTHDAEKITFICYPYSDTTTEPIRTYLHEKADPKEKRFQCGVCQYSSRAPIQIHLRAHIGEKAYCCSLCNFGSVYKQALKTHYVKVHSWTRSELAEKYEEFRSARGRKSRKGRKRKFSTINKDKLKEINTHKNKNRSKLKNNVKPGEEIYKCTLCKFSSTSKDKFEEYMKVNSNNKCDKLTDSKEAQKNNKTYICVNCKVSAKVGNGMTMRSDNKPVKLQNPAKTQISVQLDVGISVTLKDKKHKKTNRIKTLYQCANCNFTTVNIPELSKHGSNHPNGNLYKCGNCDFTVDNVNRLESHMSTHIILYKRYKCLLCKYRTYKQSEFREHRKVHLDPSDEVSSEELLDNSSEEKDMEVDF